MLKVNANALNANARALNSEHYSIRTESKRYDILLELEKTRCIAISYLQKSHHPLEAVRASSPLSILPFTFLPGMEIT